MRLPCLLSPRRLPCGSPRRLPHGSPRGPRLFRSCRRYTVPVSICLSILTLLSLALQTDYLFSHHNVDHMDQKESPGWSGELPRASQEDESYWSSPFTLYTSPELLRLKPVIDPYINQLRRLRYSLLSANHTWTSVNTDWSLLDGYDDRYFTKLTAHPQIHTVYMMTDYPALIQAVPTHVVYDYGGTCDVLTRKDRAIYYNSEDVLNRTCRYKLDDTLIPHILDQTLLSLGLPYTINLTVTGQTSSQPTSQAVGKTARKAVDKTVGQTSSQGVGKTTRQKLAASQPVIQSVPVGQPLRQTASQANSQAHSQAVSQPVIQSADQPVRQSLTHRNPKPAGQPLSKLGHWSVGQPDGQPTLHRIRRSGHLKPQLTSQSGLLNPQPNGHSGHPNNQPKGGPPNPNPSPKSHLGQPKPYPNPQPNVGHPNPNPQPQNGLPNPNPNPKNKPTPQPRRHPGPPTPHPTPPHTAQFPLTFINIIQNGVVTSNGEVFSGSVCIMTQRCTHSWYRPAVPSTVDTLPLYDEVLTITQQTMVWYYHATIEDLPRVAPYLTLLWENPHIKVHVTHVMYHLTMLRYLGIPQSRIVWGAVRGRVVYLPAGTTCGRPNVFNTQLLAAIFRQRIEDRERQRIEDRERQRIEDRQGQKKGQGEGQGKVEKQGKGQKIQASHRQGVAEEDRQIKGQGEGQGLGEGQGKVEEQGKGQKIQASHRQGVAEEDRQIKGQGNRQGKGQAVGLLTVQDARQGIRQGQIQGVQEGKGGIHGVGHLTGQVHEMHQGQGPVQGIGQGQGPVQGIGQGQGIGHSTGQGHGMHQGKAAVQGQLALRGQGAVQGLVQGQRQGQSIIKQDTVLLIHRSSPDRQFRHHAAILSMLREEASMSGLTVRVFYDNPPPPLPEYIHLFSRAALIVAPHGAGLANIVFSRPGTVIIEGLCEMEPHYWLCMRSLLCYVKHSRVSLSFRNLATVLGQHYVGLVKDTDCLDVQPADLQPYVRYYLQKLQT